MLAFINVISDQHLLFQEITPKHQHTTATGPPFPSTSHKTLRTVMIISPVTLPSHTNFCVLPQSQALNMLIILQNLTFDRFSADQRT